MLAQRFQTEPRRGAAIEGDRRQMGQAANQSEQVVAGMVADLAVKTAFAMFSMPSISAVWKRIGLATRRKHRTMR